MLELQILGTLLIMIYQRNQAQSTDLFNRALMIVLMVEHIVFYIAGIYRGYDIKKNGKLDLDGIMRAPTESRLHSIEIFADCLMIGFVARRMLELDSETFHNDSLVNYWATIDCCLLIMMHGYTFICN